MNAQYLWRKVNDAIASPECRTRLKRLRYPTIGEITYGEGIILDWRKEIIPTAIHECIHHLHQDWPEAEVDKAEIMLVRHLSDRKARNFLKRLANALA